MHCLPRRTVIRRGTKRKRSPQGDNDFERLRSYQQGIAKISLTGKTTARLNEIIVREFQATQNQNINIVIDHGRLMQTRLAEGNHGFRQMIDEVIDAALMLTHVAITMRDLVGMVTFNDRVTKWEPAKLGNVA